MEPRQPKYGKKMWARKLREWENRCAKYGRTFPSSELVLQRHFLVRTAFTAICGDNRATFVLPKSAPDAHVSL